MRFILVFITLIVVFNITNAQQGNQWITGHGNIIDFNVVPTKCYMQCDSFSNSWYPLGHSTISDNKGKILFTFTGVLPISRCENIIENGKPNINNHFAADNHGIGYLIQQSIILPKRDSEYYAIYNSVSNKVYDSSQNGGEVYFDQLIYDLVDMNKNEGSGQVIDKYHPITLSGKMSINSLSAVRHANGRDWWLVKPHINQHYFYTFLIAPEKISGPFEQDMNGPDFISNNWGQSNFSMDGQYYALTQYGSDFIQINTFDRCTGKMTKYRSIVPPSDTLWYYDPIAMKDTFTMTSAGTGVCFSPNNQFLYLVTPITVWQYDMNTEEMINLNTDTFYNGATNLTAYNAPDGRIYTGNWDNTNYGLSFIEFPNLKGIASHFCQICLTTPFTTGVPPNMPNYELGALVGSPCDTIKPPITPPNYSSIKIYPNPARDHLSVELPDNTKRYELVVHNLLGENVFRKKEENLLQNKISLPIGFLTTGFYSIKIVTDKEEFIGKFLKD